MFSQNHKGLAKLINCDVGFNRNERFVTKTKGFFVSTVTALAFSAKVRPRVLKENWMYQKVNYER